jgi:hypothetical protein
MPFRLELPPGLAARRWKVKMRDREGPEEPHVSLLNRTRTWRLGLRSFEFLDREPPPAEVPEDLLDHVRAHADRLRTEWDRMYPANPVAGAEDDDA